MEIRVLPIHWWSVVWAVLLSVTMSGYVSSSYLNQNMLRIQGTQKTSYTPRSRFAEAILNLRITGSTGDLDGPGEM